MHRLLLLLAALVPAACAAERAEPVEAEFLLAAGDSTFWVRVTPAGARMRGSPIHLAVTGGRFHELYVAESDRSMTGALIVGHDLYRRDLLTGDSLLVLADSVIANFARWYASRAPEARPLAPEEEFEGEVHVTAGSELTILDQHGRYISYEYAASVDVEGDEGWEVATRGVVDIVTGARMTVGDLFGAAEAARIREAAGTLLARTTDSILASPDARAGAAAEVLGEFRIDPTAFTIVAVGDRPAVEFVLPGSGVATGGMLLTLDAIPAGVPPWWTEVRERLPAPEAGGAWRWERGALTVRAAPDRGRHRITVRTAAGRERTAGRVPDPAWRIFWLDPETDSTTLRALSRAFDEAAFYDEDVRTAMNDRPSRSSDASAERPRRPVSISAHETSEIMMPQHANNLGHVFGGVILSMMDRTAAVSAIRHARRTCVTVSVDRVDFREPIHLGELVVMKASVNFAGRTSMEIGVRVEAENLLTGVRRHTNSCYLTFVAVDDDGRPLEVPLVEPETAEDRRRYTAAQERRRRRLEERTAERR